MNLAGYATTFIVAVILGELYRRYKLVDSHHVDLHRNVLIKKYFTRPGLVDRPILWIHFDRPVNQRWWPSFYSRNTRRLNQPYIVSCVKTIIKQCGESFDVALIDDESFKRLLPGWSIDFSKLADPVKRHFRLLGMAKLLYYFGGMTLPPSTIVLKDLMQIYAEGIEAHTCFSLKMLNRANTANVLEFFPSHRIMGCRKNSPVMREFMLFLERLNSKDYTSEPEFLGQADRWLYQACQRNEAGPIDGAFFGIHTRDGQAVGIEELLGDTFIDFDDQKLHAIYLPEDEILSRLKYGWFPRLSQAQLHICDAMAAKYLLIAQGGKD